MFTIQHSTDGTATTADRFESGWRARRVATAPGPRRRRRARPAAIALVMLAALLPACDDDSTDPDDDSFIGTWVATSLIAFQMDFIDEGMAVTATFSANNTFSIAITDDQINLCDPGPNCVLTGTYTSTATTITATPTGEDPLTFNYDVDDDEMTFSGSIGVIPVAITWDRQ